MVKEKIIVLGSMLGFVASLYFGLPAIFGQRSSEQILQSASQSDLHTLQKGQISRALLGNADSNHLYTLPDTSRFSGTEMPMIFPPDLTFREPPKLSEAEKERVAQAQRISLLENQVNALQIQLSLEKSASTSNWKWGLGQLWALVIWFFGTIATTALKHNTEKYLKKWLA